MVPIFGWIMFAGAKISALGGINTGTIILLAVVIAAYAILIFFGQIRNKNTFIVSPDQYLEHRLQNVIDARTAYKASLDSDNEYFTRKYSEKHKESLSPKLAKAKHKYEAKNKILIAKEHSINAQYKRKMENMKDYAKQLLKKTPQKIEKVNKQYQSRIEHLKAKYANNNDQLQVKLDAIKLPYDKKNNYLTTLEHNAVKLVNNTISQPRG
jgi:hypothetical protein